MLKVTVLYGHPTSPDDFERYYAETHLPIAETMKGVARAEVTKFLSGPDGARPSFYRMAELYFETKARMLETLGSPEGRTTIDDLTNFATGGVTILIGSVEE